MEKYVNAFHYVAEGANRRVGGCPVNGRLIRTSRSMVRAEERPLVSVSRSLSTVNPAEARRFILARTDPQAGVSIIRHGRYLLTAVGKCGATCIVRGQLFVPFNGN